MKPNQIPFDEYYQVLKMMLDKIDKCLVIIKNRQKNLSVYHGFNSYKEFLKSIEDSAIKSVAKELNLTPSTIKDRWKSLTLPLPVYDALETGKITYSKAKLLTKINFDFENNNDVQISQEIIDYILSGAKISDINIFIEEKSKNIWNESSIIMKRFAEQHSITEQSTF